MYGSCCEEGLGRRRVHLQKFPPQLLLFLLFSHSHHGRQRLGHGHCVAEEAPEDLAAQDGAGEVMEKEINKGRGKYT